MKYNIIVISLIILTIKVNAQYPCQGGQNVMFGAAFNQCNNNPWVLVFEDNFNGNGLDLSKWRPETGVPRDLNFESQKAWHKPENVVVENGLLKIISKRETLNNMPVVTSWDPYTVKYENFDYTSGEIWTKFKFAYGKFEARVKIPRGKGFFPAFWTFATGPWNEIDIFEFKNEKTLGFYDSSLLSKVHQMTLHYDYDANGVGNSCNTHYTGADFSQDFHIFTVIWEKDKIEWYMDGYLKRRDCRYYTLDGMETGCIINSYIPYSKKLIYPQDPMAIIFNTAIQNGSDSPDALTPFPSQMEIEWVRYYKRISNPCQDVIITNASQFPLDNQLFNAMVGKNIVINCTYTVTSGQQFDIVAGNSVTLGTGFSAESGSVFNVRIEPTVCNPN